MSRVGVLVLSHGTPHTRAEIEPFYTRIRHGRPPSPELLAELADRYAAIGGLSPLAERTAGQVDGIARALEARDPGRFAVEGATKYSEPTIEDGVERLVAAGVTGVVGLVLSPLNAPSSTEDYHRRAEAALGGRAGYLPVWSWWDAAGFPELLAERVRAARVGPAGGAVVVFTAHSLPVRIPGTQGYEAQLAALAGAVADAAHLDEYLVCWQSAGRTADEWLGPSLLELLSGVDPADCPAVLVCPAGFVSDHLEVLFDIDIEASRAAALRGIAVSRTTSLNDDPAFLEVLADVVESIAAST